MQLIDTTPGGGDSGKVGGDKINANFTELMARLEAFERAAKANVTEYPAAPDVEVQSRNFDPALGYADVEIILTGPSPTTVHAFLSTGNGTAYSQGTGISAGAMYVKSNFVVKFMPGEVRKVCRVMLGTVAWTTGATFSLYQSDAPSGHAERSATRASGTLTANAASPGPIAPLPAPVPLRAWPFGGVTPDFDLDIPAIQLTDTFAAGKWRTAPHNGSLRSQPDNKETAFYTYAADGYLKTTGGMLTFGSGTLDTPRVDGGISYPHAASMLTGLNVAACQTRYGGYEFEVKMPSAPGAWPALWFMGVRGGPGEADLRVMWPPEFDLHEGFLYEPWAIADSGLCAHIHQGPVDWRVYAIGCSLQSQMASGVSGLTTDFHKYAVEFTAGTIYCYIDGVEFYRCVNPFVNLLRWFPLMNVTVKKNGTYTGGDATGEMKVRALRMWRKDS